MGLRNLTPSIHPSISVSDFECCSCPIRCGWHVDHRLNAATRIFKVIPLVVGNVSQLKCPWCVQKNICQIFAFGHICHPCTIYRYITQRFIDYLHDCGKTDLTSTFVSVAMVGINGEPKSVPFKMWAYHSTTHSLYWRKSQFISVSTFWRPSSQI